MGVDNNQKVCNKDSNNIQIFDNYHYTQPITLYPNSSIIRILDKLEERITQNRFNNMASNEGSSNQMSLYIDNIYIKFHEIDPPGVRSFIETPIDLKNKNRTINPNNNNNKCFLYSVGISIFLNILMLKIQVKLLKNYLIITNSLMLIILVFLQMEKISINLTKIITIFEYNGFKIINKKDDVDSDININDKNVDCYIDIRDGDDSDYDEKHDDNNNTTMIAIQLMIKNLTRTRKCIQISDVRISPFAIQRKYLVELLIIRDGEKEHYLSIRNISRLLHGSNYDRGMYSCEKCYCSFRTPEILNKKHIPLGTDIEKPLKIIPKKGKNDIVNFKDHYIKLLQPFMIIADFETYTDLLGMLNHILLQCLLIVYLKMKKL